MALSNDSLELSNIVLLKANSDVLLLKAARNLFYLHFMT